MIDFENKDIIKLSGESIEKGYEKVKEILIDGEKVIDSYVTMRDRVVFTNYRIISINVQGVTGVKKDYTSLPYKHIQFFSIETAGLLELDGELTIVMNGRSAVKFELSRSENIRDLCRAISEHILI